MLPNLLLAGAILALLLVFIVLPGAAILWLTQIGSDLRRK